MAERKVKEGTVVFRFPMGSPVRLRIDPASMGIVKDIRYLYRGNTVDYLVGFGDGEDWFSDLELMEAFDTGKRDEDIVTAILSNVKGEA